MWPVETLFLSRKQKLPTNEGDGTGVIVPSPYLNFSAFAVAYDNAEDAVILVESRLIALAR
jgi:hypothetical protein